MNPPASTRLGEIHAPALIIVGELDTADFRGIAATLAREIPDTRLVVVPGAGHLPSLEAPDFFNTAVLRFLRDISYSAA
jgi:3-oxoadipate enol-lactonase